MGMTGRGEGLSVKKIRYLNTEKTLFDNSNQRKIIDKKPGVEIQNNKIKSFPTPALS